MRSSLLTVKLSTVAIVAWFTIVALGCGTPNEGDRCNPSLSHDECGGSGLVCGIPAGCDPSQPNASPYANGEAYCCPANGVSSNPNCNGSCNPCQYADSLINPPPFCLEGGVPPPIPDGGSD